MTYPSAALTDICNRLLDDWELTQEQIEALAGNLAGECRYMRENQEEAAWHRQQESLMESGGADDSAYRRDMINAGRGNLLP